MLRTQFKMKLIVYTQDTTYSKKLGKQRREEENACAVPSVFTPLKIGTSNTVNSTDTGATLKEMMKHLKSYYQVSAIEILYILFCAFI